MNSITEHKVSKTEEKYYDKFPLVKLITQSTEDLLTGKNWSNRSIQPRGNCTKKDYLVQLAAFRKSVKVELPCTVEVGYDRFDDDEAITWYHDQFKVTKSSKKAVVIDAEDLELGEEEL